MSKNNRGASRVPEGVTESLSTEETDQMATMAAADNAAPEAAPVAEAAPAAAAKPEVEKPEGAEGADANKGGDAKKTVPLAALHESRAETKAVRDALVTAEANNAKVMERFEAVLAKFAPKEEPPQEEVIPDPNVDPVGYVTATMKATGKTLATVEKELSDMRAEKARGAEQNRQREAIGTIITTAATQETEFVKTNPDYWEASNFLVQSRNEELEEMGYDQLQRNAIINQEKVSIAAQALAQGKNPAAVVYGIAKRRGYAGKKPPAEEGPKQDEVTPAAKLEKARAGAEISASLSDLTGNAPVPLTVTKLLEMSDADFARIMNTKEGKALMGQG